MMVSLFGRCIIIVGLFISFELQAQCAHYPMDDSFITYSYFSISYSEPHEQADWVCYRLTEKMITGYAERKDNFRIDSKVTTGSSVTSDYKNSGYDRGHLAPAADFKFSQKAMDESFLMSNISPQVPGFNRGIWKELEELIRSWATIYGKIDVVTGPIFKDNLGVIGNNQVVIPGYFYKAIVRQEKGKYEGIAFVLPNSESNESLKYYVLSIDNLEYAAGINFYAKLNNSFESKVDINSWSWGDDNKNSDLHYK